MCGGGGVCVGCVWGGAPLVSPQQQRVLSVVSDKIDSVFIRAFSVFSHRRVSFYSASSRDVFFFAGNIY